jgi:putative glutamine amidotransferase
MKPIIGLTTYGRHEKTIVNVHYQEYYHIPAVYIDAVRRAGGIPILLPPGEPDWQESLQHVAGVVVIGGSDIHPDNYNGNAQHPQLTVHDTERDASEIELVQYVVAQQNWPVLCICRGMQVLNVALGGTMTEHIPDNLERDIHRGPDGGWTVQPVQVNPESLLAAVMGTTEVATYSGHHQAVKTVAPGLEVVAHAPDGIIEALAMPDHPWLIAVQWHPEVSAGSDPTQQALFDAFVSAARQRMAANPINPVPASANTR